MGISNSNKELSVTRIGCGDTFQVKISLTAEPSIMSSPTDIVLILDRSGSMAGSPLANLKNGAKKFIDIIDEATDGKQDGQIGHGSHIAVVSFADTATKDTQLTTSVADLKTAVNALTAGGRTNHADAFTEAVKLFNPLSANKRVMVMFTDGKTTVGADASPIAAAAKAQGIVIYVIGLSGNGGIDEAALRDWASDPDSAYVAITPDDEELEDLFEDLANNITKPGATNIVIDEEVVACFKIVSLSTPTKGTASLLSETSLQWKIGELGEGSFMQGPIFFHYGSHTKIGKRFFGNYNLTVQDDALVTIGDDCNFGPNVTIVTPVHPMLPDERFRMLDADGNEKRFCYAKPVTIGNSCWFGANVVVCSGATIGDNCVIGAGSVVVKDIPANSFAAGNPCRVIREITEADSMKYKPEILADNKVIER